MRLAIVLAALALAGCSSPQSAVPVQPVKIIGSDFCRIAGGKLDWDVADTPQTITGIRKFNAKYTSRCVRKSTPTT